MKERPILFSAPMVRALLAGTKTQTRRVITAANSLVDGVVTKREWVALDPERARVDRGPSPAGNAGPYLKAPSRDGETTHRLYPRVQAGDRLWVRETWGLHSPGDPTDWYRRSLKNLRGRYLWELAYRADWQVDDGSPFWRPSIFLKRKDSRITLDVTGVRVERLQDISEADALAEGVEPVVHESWSVWDPAIEATVSLSVEPSPELIAKHGYEDVRHIGPKVISTAQERYLTLWDTINIHRAPSKSNPWVWVVEFKRVSP